MHKRKKENIIYFDEMHKTNQKTLVMSIKNSYTCEVVQINIRFKKRKIKTMISTQSRKMSNNNEFIRSSRIKIKY